MMDLLVQVTSRNGVSPGGLVLKVPSDRPPGYLSYKPSTPVGKLRSELIEVVSKAEVTDRPRKQKPKLANLPFEVGSSVSPLSSWQQLFAFRWIVSAVA